MSIERCQSKGYLSVYCDQTAINLNERTCVLPQFVLQCYHNIPITLESVKKDITLTKIAH